MRIYNHIIFTGIAPDFFIDKFKIFREIFVSSYEIVIHESLKCNATLRRIMQIHLWQILRGSHIQKLL